MNGGRLLVSDHPAAPALMAFLAAALWGLWWIPIRFLESLGMSGASGSIAMNAGAALAAILWMTLSRQSFRLTPGAVLGAALVGAAVTTYSIAITFTDVVRVILLFYLAPAWSKIIEWAFMGRGWHWSATLTIAASLCGAYLVLGANLSLKGAGLGDLLAVLAGVCWSGGAAMVFTGDRVSPLSLTMVTAVFGTLIGMVFVALTPASVFSTSATASGSIAGAGFGLLYVLPIMVLTLWSAQRLSPAVITFLLTAEILTGVFSSVLLLDEPFGALQIAGAALILIAAVAEVFPTLRQKPA